MLVKKFAAGTVGGAAILTLMSVPVCAKAEVTMFEGKGSIPSVVGYLQVDAGPRVNTNVDLAQFNGKAGTATITQAAGNDWATSLGGIKGSTQLTPEWKAIYTLEAGFDTGTGRFNNSSGSVFSRRAYAGLSSSSFGTIFVGKNQTIAADSYSFDPMIMESASTPTLLYGRNFEAKPDNVIEYHSPNWRGFQVGVQAQLSAGGGNNTSKASNLYGISAQYDVSNLSFFGIYDVMQDAEGRYTNVFTASRSSTLGATWNLAPVKLSVGYIHLDAPDGSQANGGTPIQNPGARQHPYAPVFATKANNAWIGAEYAVSREVTVRGAVFHTTINDNAGKATLYSAGLEYKLSDNILLYGTVAQVRNSGKADFSAAIYSPPPAPGQSQVTAFTGISVHF